MAGEVLGQESVFRNEHQVTQPSVAPFLWCCHVRGPDDVHAAPDYETALKWADYINSINWRGPKGETVAVASVDDLILRAVPAPWPWSAEEHAEDLPKSMAGWAMPGEQTVPQTVGSDDATTPNTDPHPNQTAVP